MAKAKRKKQPKTTKTRKQKRGPRPTPLKKEEHVMARPTNQEIYDREVEIEEGAEAVADAAQAFYPTYKLIEAEVKKDELGAIIGYEVTMGWVDIDGVTYHIVEVRYDATGQTITSTEERPNVPPGHVKDKHEKPLKARKPKA